ncbi:hypothetical protein ACHAW5_008610 [Stephanodiscus triporus]|uniref:DDE Tnp4 domain-containing protein n=1 Tax=Stephanodiscus triporus TaxID=2934178 RepID=A0ABD3N9G3_9STRA
MSDDGCSFVVQAAACAASYLLQQHGKPQKKSRAGRVAIRRARRSVRAIYSTLGADYFRRAYRMSYESFWRLHLKLATRINSARLAARRYVLKGGRKGGRFKSPPIRNGRISTSVRLACALRIFAGGSVYDLMSNYGISHTDVMDSVWHVVHAVNNLPEFRIEYPSSVDEQRRIAADFERKPSLREAKRVGVDQMKFFCGRKGKFGLNCQAVGDVNGRILDISIAYGASAADCVAFEASDLYTRLENGLLKDGLVLFGDNAYLNSAFMATPYLNVSGDPNKKSEDNYNFYHSQLRIRVECVFGMLAARWGILRTAMNSKYTVTKSIGLVFALARLHNFCLDERGRSFTGEALMATDPLLDIDREHMLNDDDGYIEMEHSNVHNIAMPTALMDVGHHFDDVPRSIP